VKLTPTLFFVTALFIAFCSLNTYSQDEETIKVDSSIVVLNATITDTAGKAVGGLKQKDFKVLENGVEQKIESFHAEETPFAAAILLDTSGSMEERVSLARSAAIQFLGGLRSGDVAGIFNFDSKVTLVQDFSSSRDFADRFYDLRANGMTALNDAVLESAKVLAARPEKRKAIVVLSDGADTMSSASAEKALKAALAHGITIYTVDMASILTSGKERVQSQAALKNFAEKTGGRFVATPGGMALREAFKQVVGELGTQYTITYEPLNTTRDGKWRSIELRVARPSLNIRTRKGYNAPKK
jgi:Ca-activated chloride channel homolog